MNNLDLVNKGIAIPKVLTSETGEKFYISFWAPTYLAVDTCVRISTNLIFHLNKKTEQMTTYIIALQFGLDEIKLHRIEADDLLSAVNKIDEVRQMLEDGSFEQFEPNNTIEERLTEFFQGQDSDFAYMIVE